MPTTQLKDPGRKAYMFLYKEHDVTLGIVWDEERHCFDLVGDTNLVTPAAKAFFDELIAHGAEWVTRNVR